MINRSVVRGMSSMALPSGAVDALDRLQVLVADPKDRLVAPEENGPAVLPHQLDVVVRLPDHLGLVSVDHVVSSHQGLLSPPEAIMRQFPGRFHRPVSPG